MFYIDEDSEALALEASKVHPQARCEIEFQRTLRIPDDNQEYDLPPGLGKFPLGHVDDYKDKVPESWVQHGGVFLPMYQGEAMWLNFNPRSPISSSTGYPFAIKIATGKINAVSGEAWSNELQSGRTSAGRQDYVVIPEQPWLDGYCVAEGLIRQFVAMPLGEGYTAEEQLTGEAEHGGIQIVAYPMKRELYQKIKEPKHFAAKEYALASIWCNYEVMSEDEYGLAAGGLMRQQIFKDKYGIDAWDQDHPSRCFVHILNSRQYQAFTGEAPPDEPPSAKTYTEAGLPWFDYYSESNTALDGAESLAGLDSVAAKGIKKGQKPLPENTPVSPGYIVVLGDKLRKIVREGKF